MGQKQSKGKVCVSIPPTTWCFPYFCGEAELLCASKNASDSLCRMRNILKQLSTVILTPTQLAQATALLTATTLLVNLLMDRLVSKKEETSGNSGRGTTLEDALLQLKIDKSIAQACVCQLQAKLAVIGHRYNRLLLRGEIPLSDRRLEVVPALTLCEEVLELFSDGTHLFYKNPIVSSPYLVSFAGVYLAIAELSLVLIPSYRVSLVRQMKFLQSTLIQYELACVKERESVLRIKWAERLPETLISAVVQDGEDWQGTHYLDDPFLKKSPLLDVSSEYWDYGPETDFMSEGFTTKEGGKEAKEFYLSGLKTKYNRFFREVFNAVSDFSGFCSEKNPETPDGVENMDAGSDLELSDSETLKQDEA